MPLRRAVLNRTLLSRAFWAFLIGLSFLLLLFGNEHLRAGGGRFLRSDWMQPLLWLLPPLLLMRKLPADPTARRGEARRLRPEVLLFLTMVLFLFSGAVRHPWFYYLNWAPRGGMDPMGAGLFRSILLTALFLPFLLRRRPRIWVAVLLILLFSQAACLRSLLTTTGGAAVYRDDHPSFMFRLWEFTRVFPRLVSYNPYWNGGVVNFVPSATGTFAIGLPLYPLWRLAPIHEVYTLGIGLIYIVLMPWIAVASLRILGANRTAALCAGILALGVSRHFFLWMLHFGTVGASFSASFILPVCACTYRAVWTGRQNKRLFVALVVSLFFLLQWPPGALMAAPLVLSMLFSVRRWTRRAWGFLLAAGVILALLVFRQFLAPLLRGESLMTHVLEKSGQTVGWTEVLNGVSRGFLHLVAHVHEGHPVLIFLGLGGLCILPYRSLRRWCGPVVLVLACLAGWGREIKPNLQLGRMAITMFFVAVIPASVLCGRLLRSGGRSLAVVRSALLALLLMGGWSVSLLYKSQGYAPYTWLRSDIRDLVEWTRANVPEGGRLLFAGRTVHFYGRGHIAYLPALAGREMMACDYYAFSPRLVEYNYPPRPFRRPKSRLFEFMELYNVTHILTYHDQWKDIFRRYPEWYEEAPTVEWEEIAAFRVRREPSLFRKGEGTVDADFNRLRVRLSKPAEEVILKYNWSDRLTAAGGVEIGPWEAGDGVRLIRVRPRGAREFEIEYADWL